MGNAASSSSSSSSVLPPKKYDVFINFRGEDTRSNITSHLYTALSQKGIRTYKDDNELSKGDEINPSLMRAIEDSSISVVIFSENYANSKWCLNELLKIIECKRDHNQVVIPAFYKVDPSHVRHQQGTFKDAFATHETDSRLDKDIINKWRDALFQTCNLVGWVSSTYRNESEFIGDIVKDVLHQLKLSGYPIPLEGLVGMNENCDNIKMLLKEAPKLGIWGMGGIGKTTMARAIFDELSSEFDGCCFLENVREESERHGLRYLRDKLLLELLREENLYGSTPHQLVEPSAMRRLCCKNVFIVLDDVSSLQQLEYLRRDCYGLGQGSKVIITTRNRHLIIGIVDVVYEAKALTYDKSLQLFNLKAFHRDYPETGYEELAKKAVDYAKGIPLALKVLGSFFHYRTIEEWKDALARLEKTPNQDIHRVLKLSFDGLSDDEKEIFLDIAFFLKGEAEDDVIRLLEAYGFHGRIGLRTLVDKALISIIHNVVLMHDLIQEMGWEVIRQENIKEPGKRSRLRDSKEIYSVLKNNTGSDAVEGIMWNLSQMGDISLNANSFKKMTKLRFIRIYDYNGRSNCNLSLPIGLEFPSNALTYFRWDSYPLISLPSTFCLENLVDMDMRNSQLKKLWDGVHNLVNLKSINLGGSKQLIELPDFSKAQNLEKVNLSNCESLCFVHSSVLSLQKLVSLELSLCGKLKELKSETHLKSLSNLNVTQCNSLSEFSLSSEKIESLYLHTVNIEILGSAIGRLCKLRELRIDGPRLKSLPVNELCCLRSLEVLYLTDCELVIEKQELHILFEALQSLQTLNLKGCCNISELPDNIKHLSRLQRIDLTNCNRLQSIPELPSSTESVDATNCTSLVSAFLLATSIPQWKYMVKSMRLRNCLKLNECSRSCIEDYAYFSLKRATYINEYGTVCYPGSKVPEWFRYNQTMEASSSITIDLSSGLRNLLDFVFCCVIPQSSLISLNYLNCQSNFGDCRFVASTMFPFDTGDLNSDHVFLWSDKCYFKDELKKFLTGQCYEGHTDSLKLSITFYLERTFTDEIHVLTDQSFGVCPIFASEYHNFLQQLEMEFEKGLTISRSRALHELSLDGVMKYVHLSLNPATSGNLETNVVSHPEHVIPEWFTNQSSTTENSIFVDLSPDVDCLLGFVFCFFIPQFSSEEKKKSESSCQCYFEFFEDDELFEDDGFCFNGPHGWHYSMKELNSDNVFIWYDPLFCGKIINELRRHRGTIEEGTSRPRLLFEFEFGECLIKECGVHPIYASEYSDFLHQLDLKLEEGRKTKRSRESDDEEQQLAPTKKLKESSKSMASHSIDE